MKTVGAENGVITASPPALEAKCAATPSDLSAVWAQAEAEFPSSGGFGIEVTRHSAGFYIGQISRRWVNEIGDDGPFHILSYCTNETAAASLADAITDAHRSLRLGIDWMRKDLPVEGRAQ